MSRIYFSVIAVFLALVAFAAIPEKTGYYNAVRIQCDARTMFDTLFEKRDWPGARDACLRYLRASNVEDLARVSVLIDLARVHVELHETDQAIVCLKNALSILKSMSTKNSSSCRTEFLRAHALLARLYQLNGQPLEAAKMIARTESTIAQQPKLSQDVYGRLYICQLLFIKAALISAKDPEQAVDLLNKCVSLANNLPFAPQLYLQVAEANYLANSANASYVYEMLEYFRTEGKSRWGALYQKGSKLLSEKSYAEAESFYVQSLEQIKGVSVFDPRVILSNRGIAESKFGRKQFSEVLILRQQELQMNIKYILPTERAFALHRMAQCCAELGRVKAGLAYLKEEEKILRNLVSPRGLIKSRMWELFESLSGQATDPAERLEFQRKRFDALAAGKDIHRNRSVELAMISSVLCQNSFEKQNFAECERLGTRSLVLIDKYKNTLLPEQFCNIYLFRGLSRYCNHNPAGAVQDLGEYMELSRRLKKIDFPDAMKKHALLAAELQIKYNKDYANAARNLEFARALSRDSAEKEKLLFQIWQSETQALLKNGDLSSAASLIEQKVIDGKQQHLSIPTTFRSGIIDELIMAMIAKDQFAEAEKFTSSILNNAKLTVSDRAWLNWLMGFMYVLDAEENDKARPYLQKADAIEVYELQTMSVKTTLIGVSNAERRKQLTEEIELFMRRSNQKENTTIYLKSLLALMLYKTGEQGKAINLVNTVLPTFKNSTDVIDCNPYCICILVSAMNATDSGNAQTARKLLQQGRDARDKHGKPMHALWLARYRRFEQSLR